MSTAKARSNVGLVGCALNIDTEVANTMRFDITISKRYVDILDYIEASLYL